MAVLGHLHTQGLKMQFNDIAEITKNDHTVTWYFVLLCIRPSLQMYHKMCNWKFPHVKPTHASCLSLQLYWKTFSMVNQQCVTKHVMESNKCSECNEPVHGESPRYRECCETLQRLFPEDVDVGGAAPDTSTEDADQTISVVMLGGESTVILYNPFSSIQNLKRTIQTKLGPHPDKQRLLYKEQELKVIIWTASSPANIFVIMGSWSLDKLLYQDKKLGVENKSKFDI